MTNEIEVEAAIEMLEEVLNICMRNTNEVWLKRKRGYELAIQALEKQIPKTPIIKPRSPALCPSCGTELSDFECDGYYTHWKGLTMCECGQKISWEVEGNE